MAAAAPGPNEEKQIVISHFELFRKVRFLWPNKDHAHYERLAKMSIGLSSCFVAPPGASGDGPSPSLLHLIPLANCHLDITLSIDWNFLALHESNGAEESPGASEVRPFFARLATQVHGFYYSGPAVNATSPTSSTTPKTMRDLEISLVGPLASLSLAVRGLTDADDLAITRAAWHIDEEDHDGVPLKTTQLCHNNKHYPLISLASPTVAVGGGPKAHTVPIPTFFHLVTNIDRNALFPRYSLLDKMFTATLGNLGGVLRPPGAKSDASPLSSVDWSPLFLSGVDKRKHTERKELLKLACSIVQSFYLKMIRRRVNPTPASNSVQAAVPELGFASDVLIFFNSSHKPKAPSVQATHIDIAALITDTSTAAVRTNVASLSRLVLVSNFPTTEQLAAVGFTNPDNPTLLGQLRPSAQLESIRAAIHRVEQKFSAAYDEVQQTVKLYEQLATHGTVSVYNPYLQALLASQTSQAKPQRKKLNTSDLIARTQPPLSTTSAAAPTAATGTPTALAETLPAPPKPVTRPAAAPVAEATPTVNIPSLKKRRRTSSGAKSMASPAPNSEPKTSTPAATVEPIPEPDLGDINQDILARCLADIVFSLGRQKQLKQLFQSDSPAKHTL